MENKYTVPLLLTVLIVLTAGYFAYNNTMSTGLNIGNLFKSEPFTPEEIAKSEQMAVSQSASDTTEGEMVYKVNSGRLTVATTANKEEQKHETTTLMGTAFWDPKSSEVDMALIWDLEKGNVKLFPSVMELQMQAEHFDTKVTSESTENTFSANMPIEVIIGENSHRVTFKVSGSVNVDSMEVTGTASARLTDFGLKAADLGVDNNVKMDFSIEATKR